jgi:hypothetical protein
VGRDVFEVDGKRPVRGNIAEVWVGMMRDHKVAITSYRPWFSRPGYLSAYMVSGTYLQYVPSTESQQRFCAEAL